MGLDMYLKQEQYFARSEVLAENHSGYKKEFDKATAVLEAIDYPADDVESVTVTTTVMYWRKANAIHNWFVENVQDGEDDCGSYYVDKEKLQELRDICMEVLTFSTLEPGLIKAGERMGEATGGRWEAIIEEGQVIANPELADELLPTTSGFFFGNTAYNEWYLESLQYTVEGLDRVLANLPDNAYLHYQSSW